MTKRRDFLKAIALIPIAAVTLQPEDEPCCSWKNCDCPELYADGVGPGDCDCDCHELAGTLDGVPVHRIDPIGEGVWLVDWKHTICFTSQGVFKV